MTRNKPLCAGWGWGQCDTTAWATFELVLSVYCAKSLLIADPNGLFPLAAGQQHSITPPPPLFPIRSHSSVRPRKNDDPFGPRANIVSVVDRSGYFLLQPQLVRKWNQIDAFPIDTILPALRFQIRLPWFGCFDFLSVCWRCGQRRAIQC
jgi:hypothetical protein